MNAMKTMNRVTYPLLILLTLGLPAVFVGSLSAGGGDEGGEIYPAPSAPVPPPNPSDDGDDDNSRGEEDGGDPSGPNGYGLFESRRGPALWGYNPVATRGLVIGGHQLSEFVPVGSSRVPEGVEPALEMLVRSPQYIKASDEGTQLVFDGRFTITDNMLPRQKNLHLRFDAQARGAMLVVVGTRDTHRGSIVDSFAVVHGVYVLPLGQAEVDLNEIRARALRVLGQTQLDVAVGVLGLENGELHSIWAAFNVADEAITYDVHTRN